MSLEPGQMLSTYRIVEKIGEGGMGEVYAAEDTKLKRKVALKILPAATAADPERRARFTREAQAVAALNHPNIVTIHSVEEAAGVHFLTMELVEGESLARLIPRKGMSLSDALRIGIPLADAVAAAHQQGITHRDLKPDNVMLNREQRVKVLDFGLAKLADPVPGAGSDQPTVTAEGKVLGTVHYMSPEQAEGKATDPRSDVFSLGILLYEMIAGRLPFEGDTAISTITSIMRDTPVSIGELKPEMPRHLDRVIARCLTKDPNRRYQTALGLRNELEQLKEETESGEALEDSAALSAAKKKGWWVPLAAVLLLVVLAAVLLPRWLDPPQETEGAPAAVTAPGGPRKIVVLPFENRGNPDDEYFAAGMTEEIISRLASLSGLGVISRSSAFQYDRTGKTTAQIGEDFGVEYVLEGTVRWATRADGSSRVRITPQLVRVSDDTSLWSEVFDQVIDDVFDVQSEIAENVAENLGVALLEPERRRLEARPTENPQAYQAYLRGLHHKRRANDFKSGIALAVRMFERAVEEDPQFVQAWAELAIAHSSMYHYGYDRTEARQRMARQTVDTALKLDPDSPEAHKAKGFYHYWAYKDYEPALREFEIAAERLSGDANLIAGFAWVYRRQGRWDLAVANLQKAAELDPVDPLVQRNLAETYRNLRRFAEAVDAYGRSIDLEPDQVASYSTLAKTIWYWKGDARQARAILEQLPTHAGTGYAHAWFEQHLLEGDYEAALDALSDATEPLESVQRFTPVPVFRAQAYVKLNREEQARAAFEQALAELEPELDERPDDFRLYAARAIALAGLGRKDEAVRSAKQATVIYPVSRDALAGMQPIENLALVYAMVGELDMAMDQLEYMLENPSTMTAWRLRVDPRWSPLHGHPRYEEIVAQAR